MHKSNFVLAFTPVFLHALNTLEKLDADDDAINTFIQSIAPKHLVSFGGAINKSGKLNSDYVKKAVKHMSIDQVSKYPMSLYIDSGGYQCGQGYIPQDQIPKFAELYKQFLNEYNDKFDYAFSLDIPPNDKTFKTWDSVYDMNKKTYKIVADGLDKQIRDKLIFVFHFRSPRIWDLWEKIANEFADLYSSYWSVGGVAGFNVNNRMPCWLYTLPLTYLLYLKSDDKRLKFHILGDFSWTTIFFSQLIHKFVKRHFNIKLNITYDASSIVTGNLKYRYLWDIQEDGTIHKVLLRKSEKNKSNPVNRSETNLQAGLRLLKEFAEYCNFPVLHYDDIDKEDSDSFIPEVSSYVILQSIYQYWKAEKFCRDIADKLLDLYYDDRIEEFNKECMHILQKLHGGKLSRSIYSRRAYAYTTLDIIANKDLTRAKHILSMLEDEFMFVDEVPRW